MRQPAARKGDPDIVHCSRPYREECADTVIVNGRGWSCLGHHNAPHLRTGSPCDTHVAPIVRASSSVIVEGRGAGRVWDKVGGCTWVAPNDCNVIVG